ncbi:flippase-like domain-containing protein [Thermococcus sp. 9N3]|uniref:flippase-like domain-containing protein n=1 Tax=Thermococcus sp. 9N3 TaxID=163002 RepID=UPI00197D80F7|nr:flippase-like domain-containing protein [Thermococcus sp. 9N3]
MKKYSLLAVGIAIIALLLWWAGIRDVVEILRGARLNYFLLAVIMYVLGLLSWGLRWRVLLNALGVRASFTKILLALLAGIFVNNVTPGARGGGEPVRMYFLAKETEKPYGQVFATVMMDRILDLIPVVVMLAFSTAYVYRLGSLSLTAVLVLLDLVFAGLILFTLGILLSEKKTKGALYWFFRLFERLAPGKAEKYRDRFEKAVEVDVPRFQSDFRFLIRHKGVFLLALIYSTASWFFTVLRTYYAFRAINYPVSLVDVMVVQMVGIVVGMLSVIPGGAGIIETVNSGIYVLLGINKEIAVTATLLDRLISYWIPTALGALVTTHFGAKLRRKGLIGRGRR